MRLYNPQSAARLSYFEQVTVIARNTHWPRWNRYVYRRMGSAGVFIRGRRCHWQRQRPGRALGKAKDLAEAHAAMADVKKDQWG
jgi:hypothetical protein